MSSHPGADSSQRWGALSATERPSSSGADVARLADWEVRTFTALRRQRDAATPVDDELPDDLLADVEATRAALRRLGYKR